MRTKFPEYISDVVKDCYRYVTDRRVVERQNDGTIIIRDPVTGKGWREDGTLLQSPVLPDSVDI